MSSSESTFFRLFFFLRPFLPTSDASTAAPSSVGPPVDASAVASADASTAGISIDSPPLFSEGAGLLPDSFISCCFNHAAASRTRRRSTRRNSSTISSTFCQRSAGFASSPFITISAISGSTRGTSSDNGIGGLLICCRTASIVIAASHGCRLAYIS